MDNFQNCLFVADQADWNSTGRAPEVRMKLFRAIKQGQSVIAGAVVVAKWLELQSLNLEVPSSNPPGARAFFSCSSINDTVSLIRSLTRGAYLLFFPFP